MPSHASRRNLAASQGKRQNGFDRKPRRIKPKTGKSRAWKRSALRWPMQCAAMTDAARCVGRCTALHFPPHRNGSAVANCRKAPCSPLYIRKLRDVIHRAALFIFHFPPFTSIEGRSWLPLGTGHRPCQRFHGATEHSTLRAHVEAHETLAARAKHLAVIECQVGLIHEEMLQLVV